VGVRHARGGAPAPRARRARARGHAPRLRHRRPQADVLRARRGPLLRAVRAVDRAAGPCGELGRARRHDRGGARRSRGRDSSSRPPADHAAPRRARGVLLPARPARIRDGRRVPRSLRPRTDGTHAPRARPAGPRVAAGAHRVRRRGVRLRAR
jgi:hypothetical protein